MYELLIENRGRLLAPPAEGEITWSTERKGAPGQLAMSLVRDGVLQMDEGDAVSFKKDGVNIFYGFVFGQKGSKSPTFSVTAYDQLRYFTNKDTYVYENKTLGDLLRMLAADFRLQVGALADTGYPIPSRVEDNVALFDILQNAVDLTLENTGRLYVVYDNFGRLELRDQDSMRVDYLVDVDSGEDYSYSSSIDDETYNQIKLILDNDDTGEREVYVTKHSENINRWGLLQYYDTLQKGENGAFKAEALLKMYNRIKRGLSFSGLRGDLRVRAGSLVPVVLNAGGFRFQNYMLVEKCKHIFKLDEHWMDLTMRGGDVVA